MPKYLQDKPSELYIRQGDEFVKAPPEILAVARAYPEFQHKGEIHNGQRITIMTAKTQYQAGEEIAVIHVLEAPETGHQLWVMGPKAIQEEYVDGKLASPPRSPNYDYNGAVLDSPGVDFNYEITFYKFNKPGVHTIQWKGGEYHTLEDPGLVSNLLRIEVKEQSTSKISDQSRRSAFIYSLSHIRWVIRKKRCSALRASRTALATARGATSGVNPTADCTPNSASRWSTAWFLRSRKQAVVWM